MRIHRIDGRLSSSYIIEHDRLYLVDAGLAGHGSRVVRAIRLLGRHAGEIELAVLTHPHPDHCGGLAEVRRSASFDVGCHPLAFAGVERGSGEISPGLTPWAKAYERLARAALPLLPLRGTRATVSLSQGTALHSRGLPGRVFHTPGHTHSCVSLLLDDGSAFVGDLVTGPERGNPGPTPTTMAVDLRRTFDGWRALLAAGAKRFFPAHGAPFSAEELRAAMRRLGLKAGE